MIHLLTIQGLYANQYQLPGLSIESFKSVVKSIAGGNVFIISNKFKTDIFYESMKDKDQAIIKLWAMYLNRSVESQDFEQISSYSGDEEALVNYFNSLSIFSRNRLKFQVYLASFRKAFQSDPQNFLIKKVIECDQHVVAEHESRGLTPRETLVSFPAVKPRVLVKKTRWKGLIAKMRRFEN